MRDYFAEEIETAGKSAPTKDYFAEEIEKPNSLKSIYPKVGVEAGGSSPKDIAISTIQGIGKDIAQPAFSLVNQLALNAPRSLAKKAGYEYPTEKDVTSPVMKSASYAAGVVGGIKNPILKWVGKAPSLAGKAIKGAATGAAYSPEDFTDLKARTSQAVIGGALPVGEKIVGSSISKIPVGFKLASARVVNSLIKPLLKDFSYGKNPGMGVANEGIIASSYEDLAQKIGNRRREIGSEINRTINSSKNSTKIIDASDVLKPIDDAIAQANKNPRTNQSVINRLKETKMDLLGVQQDELGKIVSQRDLSKMTPSEVAEFKTNIGDLTKWTGNASDDKIVNKALKQSYGMTKSKLNSAIPEISKLNERYANLTSAEIATKYRDKITSRQNLVALAPKIMGGGGALIGLGMANPAVVLTSIASIGADKILSSPAFKTRLASGLSKMGRSGAIQILEKYPQFRNLVVKGVEKIRKF